MKSIIVDIDGTLCPIKQQGENYKDLIPYEKMITKLNECKKKGFRIVLFTSRNMRTYKGDLELIHKYTKPELETWLKEWNIPYDEVIYGKVWPGKEGFYIDDRSVRPKEFLEHSFDELKEICERDKNLDNTAEYTFNINDINVKVRSNNPKVIIELVKLYGTYYKEAKCGTNADITINYVVGSKKKTDYPIKEKEQTELNYVEKAGNNLNIYMRKYDENDKNFVKRMFTSTLIKTLQQNGYIILHGSCASKNGEGIIISGNKRAGKTVTVLNLLSRGYDYVANDRLALKEENNHITVIGIPFSMGIILEDAIKLFDISDCKIEKDKDKQKVYLDNNDVGKKFNVCTNSVVHLNMILLPKYNSSAKFISVEEEQDLVSYLGPDNIMTDNCIHKDKYFLNELFDTNYANPEFLNKSKNKRIEQSGETFDQLDSYITNLLGESQHVLRLAYPHY